MLRIYGVARNVVRKVGPICSTIETRDADLARQMRRALTSVLLNMREASYSQGRNRHARFWNAAGSMSEVLAALDAAEDLGYVDEVDAELRKDAACVLVGLHRIVRGR